MPSARIQDHFQAAIQFIHTSRADGLGVYVHCAAGHDMRVVNSFLICSGISRSTTMVIVYLMTHLGMSFDAALAHTVACRACTCPNDGFRRQIEIFAREHRDKYLHQLHSDPKSQPLLDNDWKFIQSVTPSHNVEEEQHKLFHELMKRKQEVGIFRWNNQIEYVSQGRRTFRARMASRQDGEGGASRHLRGKESRHRALDFIDLLFARE